MRSLKTRQHSATGRHRAVVPSEGTLQLFGTNPLSFGFPGAEEPPFLLAMATSVVPQNREEMLAREKRGETVAEEDQYQPASFEELLADADAHVVEGKF